MSMEKEIAALRKKHAAGNLTDFKLRQGIRNIKQKYGVDAPSNVTKIMSFLKKTPAEAGLFTPSPRSAKARAKAKETSKKTTVSDAQKKGQVRRVSTKDMEKALTAKANAADKTKSKSSGKTWKDFKSVSAAQKAGLNYFTGSDGKKKIAITAEQLKKKGMSLRKYANSLKGKK